MGFEEIARAFPGWHLWTSRTGALICATRRTELTKEQERKGVNRTLICNSLHELASALSETDTQ